MKNVLFFNLNRITYQGGAESYIIDIGNKLLESGRPVVYIGDFRIILKLFVIIGFLLRNISFSKCKKIIKEINHYPVTDENKIKFSISSITVKFICPFSLQRRKIKSLVKESATIFVKNEFIDMMFFWLFMPKPEKKYAIIFTSIKYPETKTFRAKIHNLFYLGSIYKFFLKRYDGLIVSNMADYDLLISHFKINKEKIIYIPYGLDFDEFRKKKIDFDISGLKEEKRKILFVGRLEEQKGIEDLIKIISKANKSENNYQFIIIGDGPLKEKIEKLSREQENVIYLGAKQHGEVLGIYEKADIIVVLSRWETFCYVALEAQLSGKPVLAYDVSGPNEIILDGVSGKIIKGDWKEMLKNLDVDYNFDKNYFAYKFSQDRVLEKYRAILN
ncbi:MAG TPA: glycosyltransferase family 4 protein [Candidatus Moranbacteria bacterium]|nr:glycosyltransferase family 4 protein [Candidatus Moranbacteria bacterium]